MPDTSPTVANPVAQGEEEGEVKLVVDSGKCRTCEAKAWEAGYCSACYFRRRRTGNPLPMQRQSRYCPDCEATGIARLAAVAGRCRMHYMREYRATRTALAAQTQIVGTR
jgi:hypothetical protein